MYSCWGVYPPEYLCTLVEVYIDLNMYVLLYCTGCISTWIFMYSCTGYNHLNIYVLLYRCISTWIFMYSCTGVYPPEYLCTLVRVISTWIFIYCCKGVIHLNIYYSFTGIYPPEYLFTLVQLYIHLNIYVLL